MTRTIWVTSIALTLVAAACSHGEAAPRTTAPAPAHASAEAPARSGAAADTASGQMAAVCPMAVPGTQVSATDTPSGEALTFSTSPEQVSELRRRVHAMADLHNQHHAAGGTGTGDRADADGAMMHGASDGMGHMMPPPSTASVEDTDGGARLVLTPADPAQATQLRSAVRAHADMMASGRCAMMGGDASPR